MTDSLSSCFDKIIKVKNILRLKDEKFILKGSKEEGRYKTNISINIERKENINLVVFDIGKNSHASFVVQKDEDKQIYEGYNYNCDYIFISINDNEINCILCELKKSYNNFKKAKKQLKYSIPLMYYLKQLLTTHCNIAPKLYKINYNKICLIKDDTRKTSTKNKHEEEDKIYIFYGEEFAFNEFKKLK